MRRILELLFGRWKKTPTAHELPWRKLGKELHQAAIDGHNQNTIPLDDAYAFMLENPECFIDKEEWPADMPAVPPLELAIGYFDVAPTGGCTGHQKGRYRA